MNNRAPTPVAARKCADWLQACREIGWTADEMPRLCDLWWEFHDDQGNLTSPAKACES